MEMGIVTEKDLECATFTWYKEDVKDDELALGRCYRELRLVAINPLFDNKKFSRKLLDLVVYHEILHLRQNYNKKSGGHDKLFYRWEHEYPYWYQTHYEYETLTGRTISADVDTSFLDLEFRRSDEMPITETKDKDEY